jgi:long-chain-fatty-acid--CoA ligase ACSBG
VCEGTRLSGLTSDFPLVSVQWSSYFETGMAKANARAASRAQTIKKWAILPVDFSCQGGELTPTLKLKRSVVLEKYADVVERLYAAKSE